MKKFMIYLAILSSLLYASTVSASEAKGKPVEQGVDTICIAENDIEQESDDCIVHTRDGTVTCK